MAVSRTAVNAARRRLRGGDRRILRGKAPVIPDPKGIAGRYRAELLAYTKDLRKEVQARLIDRLPMLAAQRDASLQRIDSWDETVTQIIEALTIFGRSRASRILRGLERRAEDVANWNRTQFNSAIKKVIGVDIFSGGADAQALKATMGSWARENASLITNINEKVMTDVSGIAQRGLRSGSSPKDIAAQVKKTMKTTDARAKLIARDQVSKLNGDITKSRNEALGIDRYFWSTSGDERVRDSHSAMNGKLCRWDDPSVYSDDGGKSWKRRSSIGGYIGHPSEDYQCRCVSSPDLSVILAEAGVE